MINREEALDLVGLSVGMDDANAGISARGAVELRQDPEEMG